MAVLGDETRKDWDAVLEQLPAAAERIEVHPAADEAGSAFASGNFRTALAACERALRDDANDAYARYLAGLCRIELRRFSAAAADFDAVRAREPQSHSAQVLAEFCRRIGDRDAPPDDETIVSNFDAAYAAVAPTWTRPKKEEDSDTRTPREQFEAAIAGVLTTPELLRDPILFKLDAEALEERGPLALPLERIVKAAEQAEDPMLLYARLGVLLTEDLDAESDDASTDTSQGADRASDSSAAYARLTAAQRYQKDSLDFVRDLRADDKAPLSDELKARLEKLRAADPEEGLWMLLEVPTDPGERQGNDFVFKPLGTDELRKVEQAAAAKRFTLPDLVRQAADKRILRRTHHPFADHLADGPVRPLSTLRNILAYRTRELLGSTSTEGDEGLILRTITSLLRIADRLEAASRDSGADPLILRLVVATYRKEAAWSALDKLKLSPTDWLRFHAIEREAETETVLARAGACRHRADRLPSPTVAAAYTRLFSGGAEEWKLRRAARDPATLEWANEPERIADAGKGQARYRIGLIYAPAALRVTAALPALRALRTQALDDHRLYALIWSLGELRDRESVAWLTELLKDPRPWAPVVAAEALQKIGHGPPSAETKPHGP